MFAVVPGLDDVPAGRPPVDTACVDRSIDARLGGELELHFRMIDWFCCLLVVCLLALRVRGIHTALSQRQHLRIRRAARAGPETLRRASHVPPRQFQRQPLHPSAAPGTTTMGRRVCLSVCLCVGSSTGVVARRGWWLACSRRFFVVVCV